MNKTGFLRCIHLSGSNWPEMLAHLRLIFYYAVLFDMRGLFLGLKSNFHFVFIYFDIELGNSTDYQLYNLKEDLGQQNNLAYEIPEKLKGMVAVYEAIRGETPQGADQLFLE